MSINYTFSYIGISNAVTNVDTETTYNSATPKIITLSANDGYYFDTVPYIMTRDSIGSWNKSYMNTDETGNYITTYYIVIDDEFVTSMYMSNNSKVQLSGNAIKIPKSDKYGIISIYNPTPKQLKDIGNVRYYSGEQAVDLGNYISSLMRVFVKIPQGETQEVSLGGYGTGVECNLVEDDVVETNCGTVEIVGKYGNSMDYENTTVEIYLPLIGFKTLETNKVMNETLSLIYRTNVINGESIACIYNTTGTLLYTFTCNAGFEIPYRLNIYDHKGDVDVNANYLFGFTPTVTIRYNKAYNASRAFASDNQETILGNLQGYVKCSEVFNTINATTAEKDEIDSMLKSGVVIT